MDNGPDGRPLHPPTSLPQQADQQPEEQQLGNQQSQTQHQQQQQQHHASDAPWRTSPSFRSSASSDRPPGHGASPDLSDRVFPIRSVISLNPTGRTSGEHDYFPRLPDHGQYAAPRPGTNRADTSSVTDTARPRRYDSQSQPATSTVTSPADRCADRRRKNTLSGPISSVQADAARHASSRPLPIFQDVASDPEDGDDEPAADQTESSTGLEGTSQPIPDTTDTTEDSHPDAARDSLFTTRFKHVMTGDGHAVITGRDGDLQRCEDEPIHTPGAVQGFGLLMAIREEQDGRFLVRYVSENAERLIGYTPRKLFNVPNFLDLLTEEQQDNLLDHIDFIRDEDADPAMNGPEVFSLSIRPPRKKTIKLWCAIHINPSHPDLIICEFEQDDDREHPLRPSDEKTPDLPQDTLQSNPTMEELAESTEILSKPLRVLRSARRRRGEAGAMQVFDIMSQVQEQLAAAQSLEIFLKILVGIVKELTGFHRVMVYQFDSSFNGKVVTEVVDTTHTRDLYKGLHFPASDIPRQARDLYKLNKVRLLYDRDLETARLVCRSHEDLERPLDMSHSYLRAMSPIHLKYLTNMAVRSSMSISINAFNELWGLIACHSYGSQGMRVSFPIRKMCRLIGDTASRNIERLSYASRLQARKLINTAPTDKNPAGYIIASSDDLLKLFDADFGMLTIQGETKVLGHLEQSQEALAMLEYLRLRQITSVITSQDIHDDFPDLRYPPGFVVVAGLLYVPLSVGGSDFIVFFRKGQVKEVKWAGNPYEKTLRPGTEAYLEPRKSFKTWHETVLGKCREWSEEQVETAAVLCLVYGKFIEVWRQKEAALQNSRLTRLLLANSAHEVRTPLNAIINYLEIALEGSLDQETRDNLSKSHSASKSLIYVINDLLDLTKTEEGQELIKDEIFDLATCVREATDPFMNEARRKGIEYEVTQHPGVPRFVYGDSRRLRQAISNVAANAVQHTTNGSVKIELYVSEILEQRVRIEIVIQDTGKGMSPQQLDALFRDLEQVDVAAVDETQLTQGGEESSDRTLGLGLALVARVVGNMDGQLRLKSEEGKGSRFVIQVPFGLPDKSPEVAPSPDTQPSLPASETVPSVTKPSVEANEGEITLVDGIKHSPGETDAHAQAGHSQVVETASLNSHKSAASKESRASARSSRSDAERLIDAIQNPLTLGEGPLSSPGLVRRTSRDAHSASVLSLAGSSTARSLSPARSLPYATHPLLPATPEGQDVGFVPVRDAKTPIRPVKIPDDYFDEMSRPHAAESSRIFYEASPVVGSEQLSDTGKLTTGSVASTSSSIKLQVLIAEDDPINLRILRKRLEKAGHEVHHAVNGEECATVFREQSKKFDVVLMDMQMPIMDGLTSTKTIRSVEQSAEHGGHSALAAHNGRIPIFAVSASLIEREKNTYVGAGFDGWILKPVDFKRLNTLLLGIVDDEVRDSCLYQAGEWERGGWFHSNEKAPPSPIETGDSGEETPNANPQSEPVGGLTEQPKPDAEPSSTEGQEEAPQGQENPQPPS
ncbi:phytochrome B [Plectosphaerella plurivora]|uniref:Phytochrome B n=1 Tax=Plectosphaerella plurivora TaxID=936078 RepID=A0A9P8V762_9PEZI|nr:phytochrome B [Plectosphaerella plurivora]